MKKIRLNILGLSYSQTHSGAYALLLSEEGGKRRLPIIIGSSEAQAIAIQLEGIVTPRPLTHDLFVRMAAEYNITIREVVIYKLEEGIFYSEIVSEGPEGVKRIDSRTSDAVALALRFDAPIYTREELLQDAGVFLNIEEQQGQDADDPEEAESSVAELDSMNKEQLEKALQEAIEKEDYENASRIRDEINRRKNE